MEQELSFEQFLHALVEALQGEDSQRLKQLVVENPFAAKQFCLDCEFANKKKEILPDQVEGSNKLALVSG